MTATSSSPHSALSLRFTVQPGRREALLAELAKILDLCAREPEFVAGYLHESADCPYEIRLFEIWRGTRADFERVQGPKPYRQEYLRNSRALVAAVEVDWSVVART